MKILKYFLIYFVSSCLTVSCRNFEETKYFSDDIRGVIENTINTTINRIIANLTDPISIDAKHFDFGEGEAISGKLNITSLIISGVKDFVAKEIKVDVGSQKIYMKVGLTEFSSHFKYWADLSIINLLPLYGHGRMSISFDEVEVDVQATGNTEEGPKIKDVVLLFSINEATFDLKGLIHNSEYSALVGTALTDNFANFVDQNKKIISEIISPVVETVVNTFLEPTSTKIRITGLKIMSKT